MNSGLDEVSEYFVTRIYEGWNKDMFNKYREEHKPENNSTNTNTSENEYPFDMNDFDRHPGLYEVWNKLFGVDVNDEKFKAFLQLVEQNNELSSLCTLTKKQINDVLNAVKQVKKDDFTNVFSLINTLNNTNTNSTKPGAEQNVSVANPIKLSQRSPTKKDVGDPSFATTSYTNAQIGKIDDKENLLKTKLDPTEQELFNAKALIHKANAFIEKYLENHKSEINVPLINDDSETIKKVQSVLNNVKHYVNSDDLSPRITVGIISRLALGFIGEEDLKKLCGVHDTNNTNGRPILKLNKKPKQEA